MPAVLHGNRIPQSRLLSEPEFFVHSGSLSDGGRSQMSYGSLPVSPMIPVRPAHSRYPVRKLPHQRSEPVDFQKDTGYGKPLLLSSGEFDSTLSDICIISIGKCHDKFVGIGILCSGNHFFPCRIWLSISYIFKIVPANRYTSCCTIPMWSRRLFNVTLRTSFPSTRIHPPVTS